MKKSLLYLFCIINSILFSNFYCRNKHSANNLKLTNSVDYKLIFYVSLPKYVESDSIILKNIRNNANDLLNAGCKVSIVKPHSTINLVGIEYCDRQTWNKYVHEDTLMVIIINKEMLDKTNDLTQSIVKNTVITYDSLGQNQCEISCCK